MCVIYFIYIIDKQKCSPEVTISWYTQYDTVHMQYVKSKVSVKKKIILIIILNKMLKI